MKPFLVLTHVTTFLLGAIVGGLAVASVAVSRVEVDSPVVSTEDLVVPGGAVKYNCELSDGRFESGACVCPIEGRQTQEMMYDESTGFCQSSEGGPGGDAFAAWAGLPYGNYDYWNGILVSLCENSEGSRSGAACICPDGKTFSKETGTCESAR